MRDCCLAIGKEAQVPEFFAEKLA
ncbi:hypothetical protein [Nostoc sp.]